MPAMPTIDYKANADQFNDDELELIKQIVKPSNSTLRATKPTKGDGTSAYVWRMVAFNVSPKPAHQCMPVMAVFDLPGDGYKDKALQDRLDELADRIINLVPPAQWYGVRRWGNVLGL